MKKQRSMLFSYSVVLFSSLLFMSCHKSKSPSIDYKKLNGNWIAIGTGNVDNFYSDAFLEIDIKVVDPNHIYVYGDTLVKTADNTFKWDGSYAFHQNYQILTYNADGSISFSEHFSASNSEEGYTASTANYHSNPSLKQYIPDIEGTKILTGMYYDTFLVRPVPDSSSPFSATITFIAVNDSTISFNGLGGDTLHYKQTDNTAQTIMFQPFHGISTYLTTLTYNYATKAITFETESFNSPWVTHIILH